MITVRHTVLYDDVRVPDSGVCVGASVPPPPPPSRKEGDGLGGGGGMPPLTRSSPLAHRQKTDRGIVGRGGGRGSQQDGEGDGGALPPFPSPSLK